MSRGLVGTPQWRWYVIMDWKLQEGWSESMPCQMRYCQQQVYVSFQWKWEIIHVVYFNANNLYGWAIGQSLPYGGIEWFINLENFYFNASDDSSIGYILEVDFYYPSELQDEHIDIPLCPEYSKPPSSSQEKLLTTVLLKQKYTPLSGSHTCSCKRSCIIKK